MLPLTLPIWLGGLWFLFFDRKGKDFPRAGLGLRGHVRRDLRTQSARVLPVAGLSPFSWREAACCGSAGSSGRSWPGSSIAYPALMVAMGAVFAPMLLPVLPVETYIRYAKALHMETPAIENLQAWPSAADLCVRIRLAGDGGDGRRRLQQPARRCAAEDGDLRPELRAGGRHRSPRAEVRHCPTPSAATRTTFSGGPRGYTGESVIIFEGTQEHWEQYYATCREAGARVASVLHAEGALRRVLLPRAQNDHEPDVAHGEELALMQHNATERGKGGCIFLQERAD